MTPTDFKHHCTLTFRERDLSGNDRGEQSMHLIGTEDQIATKVTEFVKSRLNRGGGPVTLTPIHPVNIWPLDKD